MFNCLLFAHFFPISKRRVTFKNSISALPKLFFKKLNKMKYVYVLCLITLCVASVIGMAYPRAVDGGNGTPLKAAFGPLQKAESASRVKREANGKCSYTERNNSQTD